MNKYLVPTSVIYEMQEFHFKSHYYSGQDDCQAQYMGDPRGTHSRATELWTPLSEGEANYYWIKCDCGLRESVEKILQEVAPSYFFDVPKNRTEVAVVYLPADRWTR